MDLLKLYDKLVEDPELKDIAIDDIFRVAYAIFKLIASGECFYRDDFD